MENKNPKEDNRNDFLKLLEMNVVDKKESLKHYNEIIKNEENSI